MAAKSTPKRARVREYDQANLAAAKIILSNRSKYAETSLMLQWAEATLRRHEQDQQANAGPLFRSSPE